MPPRWLLRISSSIHVSLYRLTGGRLGKTMNDMPVLLLTTTGRRTGNQHIIPVVFMKDGLSYIIAPGVIETPDWYLNLKANPQANIQVGRAITQVMAVEAAGEEHRRLWAMAPAYWKDYQKNAKRELPIIMLQALK